MIENPKEATGRRKVPLQMNPPIASHYQALAQQHGADKYGPWNWREAGIQLMTYVGAVKRHADAIIDGEWFDPDSGLPHFAHIMAGSAVAIDAWHGGMVNDDTPGRCLNAVKAGDAWVVPCGRDS